MVHSTRSSDLTVLFPDTTNRENAVAVCYPGSTIDPDPAARQQCYYDYCVTLDASYAQDTTAATEQLLDHKQVLGE